jgi:hypothetical protein
VLRAMDVEFDLDGSISAEAAVKIARAAFDRNHKDAPFLPPLAKLLMIANNPVADITLQRDAARDALPYYHRQLPELAATTVINDLGPCQTPQEIIDAQAKVMQEMATGRLATAIGKQFIESLALMARTHEAAFGNNGPRTLQVIGGLPTLEVEDNVVPFVGPTQEPKTAAE